MLVLAGPPQLAIAWRADGTHGRSPHCMSPRPLLRTTPAHGRTGLVRASRCGADLAFLSPVFPTRSHPGSRTLGRVRFGLAQGPRNLRIVALGGMDRARFRGLAGLAYGWAAIDAWSADQKRKVVPK